MTQRFCPFLVFLISLILILTLPPQKVFSQSAPETSSIDYFYQKRSKDFHFALDKSNQIYRELKNQGYPYPLEAASIVFPELIRYSELQDEIESIINELLAYTSDESNGFSIGIFQMKPQFASQMEKIVSSDSTLKSRYPKIAKDGKMDSPSDRHDRIIRLKDYDYQIEYLKAFVDYEIKNLNLQNESQENRIKYLSASYNAGLQFTKDLLERYFSLNTFPSGKRGLYFNYQQICMEASRIIKN